MIQQVCSDNVLAEEKKIFIQSALEDLQELTVNTISGLGISETEFNEWKQRNIK